MATGRSPTERALEHLRDDGWNPWVVERRIGPFTRDLYGCIDLIALRGIATLAVQVTSADNHMARLRKVQQCEHLPDMLAAGWLIEVWSYRKLASGRYARRVERVEKYHQDPAAAGPAADIRAVGPDERDQAAGSPAAAEEVAA